MARGVPMNGRRAPRRVRDANGNLVNRVTHVGQAEPEIEVIHETEEEILTRIKERFEILAEMTSATADGDVRALIVSGPAGLGKSWTVEHNLVGCDHKIVKGYVKATALYKLLYAHRFDNQVLVFDDADDVFLDEGALQLLKAALDTTERRVISYMSEGILIDEDSAERLPKSFEFRGAVIFITNYDFDAMIEKGNRLSPHLAALVSRAHYIDLTMKTRRDYLVRIRQVIGEGMLNDKLDAAGVADVLDFIEKNSHRLREISLRIAKKIADLRRKNDHRWMARARATCCKN